MNILHIYIFLSLITIATISYIISFIYFYIRKQKLEEYEQEIKNLKQEIRFDNSYVFAKEYDTKKIGNIHIFFRAFKKFDYKQKYRELYCFSIIINPKKFKRYDKKAILTFTVSEDFSKLCDYLEETKKKYWYIEANLECLEHNLDNLCVKSFKITKNKEIIIELIPSIYLKNMETIWN